MAVFEIEPRKRSIFALEPSALEALWAYGQAYREAANTLVESKAYSGSGRPDYGSFPIAFLYRHSLELLLKSILCRHHPTYRKDPAALFKRGHKFDDYLKELREMISATPLELPRDQWKHLEEVLDSWREKDAESFVFRYSVKKTYSVKKDGRKGLIDPDFTFSVPKLAKDMKVHWRSSQNWQATWTALSTMRSPGNSD